MYYYNDNKGRMPISRSTVSVDICSTVRGQESRREIGTGFPPSQCQAGTLDLLNHLYSVAAVASSTASFAVTERVEYSSYGDPKIFAAGTDGTFYTADDVTSAASGYGNEYTFTGRRLDTLDSGNLQIRYYRNRYYSPDMGRFLQKDPHGINPDGNWNNPYSPRKQFTDGGNLYLYSRSNPIVVVDPWGKYGSKCGECLPVGYHRPVFVSWGRSILKNSSVEQNMEKLKRSIKSFQLTV
jgi:RHS repeat-associated protein